MSRPPSSNGKRFGSKNGNISFLTVSICNPRKKVKRYFVMSVEITDNSKEVSAAIKAALLRGLEKCGLVAEGYAKKLCPVDTGNLRNSITHVVDEQEPAAIIGTDSEYGAYVELGTGIYAEGGGGRPTPWVYQDAKGNWHYTRGNKAQPFLKPAAADHAIQYRKILEDELK
nr:MAG TPA: putative tail component [Caudoviricetes sp.]